MSGKFRKVLMNLIKETIPPTITGKVKSVDLQNYTCVVSPSDGGPDYEEVRLKATVDNSVDGIVCEPAVGSEVTMASLFNNEHAYYICRFSKVKKWHLKTVSGTKLELDDKGFIKFNDGKLGGLPLINPLKAELTRLEAKMMAGFAAAGAAMAVYSGILDGGASAATFSSTVAALPQQVLTPLENKKIVQ
jgi:hypothetical protein